MNELYYIASLLGNSLAEQKMTICTAESCTGGLLAKIITDTPGSSDYFAGGLVTYDNRVKVDLLKIPFSIIKKEGAVSAAVARRMAQQAGENFEADIVGHKWTARAFIRPANVEGVKDQADNAVLERVLGAR